MKQKLALVSLFAFVLTLGLRQTVYAQAKPTLQTAPVSISIKPMVDGPPRTASEVFSEVSPAVAYIETPSGSGSGVLVEGRYLLTNAHVVYPYEQVRVVFPDGSEHLDAPVFAWDLMADLALVGPIETQIEPLALVDGSDIEIGHDVYLIGYPGEIESFPQPTITKGILSRVRHWDTLDLSLFQSDTTLVPGQSGGVLTTHQGDVVGISTFIWNGFGISTSVRDALPRIKAMLILGLDNALGERGLDFDKSATTHEGILRNNQDERTFVLESIPGTKIDLYVEGDGIPYFSVVDEYGYSIVDSHAKGESGSAATFTVPYNALYYVRVSQYLDDEYPFSLTGSHPTSAYDDPDDGIVLERGESLVAGFDTSLDRDYYEVYLDAGELVEISVDSMRIDSALTLHFVGSDVVEIVTNGYSGDGVFGDNDKLIYRAPADGIYRLIVEDNGVSAATGGYFLSIDSAESDDEPTVVEMRTQLVELPTGPMALYASDDYALEILFPFDSTAELDGECWSQTATFCINGFDVQLAISEQDLAFVDPEITDLDRYVDYLLTYYEFEAPGFELIGRETITTLQGLTGETFTFLTDAGLAIASGVVFVDDANGVAFEATYTIDSEEEYEWMAPLLAESFASFRSWGLGDRLEDPIHYLDQGIRLMTGSNYTDARNALTKAIELDSELIPAYVQRAYVYGALDDPESLVADMEHAISLAPDDPLLYLHLAELLYRSQQYEDAMDAIDEAIWLDNFDADLHILRAKIAAMQGEIDMAYNDLNDALMLGEGFMVWEGWQTLGFAHLLTEDFENAAFEYDYLYDSESYTPHVLLGRGIAYAELDENDVACSMLDEGIEIAIADGFANDPQLAALYDLAKDAQRKLSD